jgi:hypothetical protein
MMPFLCAGVCPQKEWSEFRSGKYCKKNTNTVFDSVDENSRYFLKIENYRVLSIVTKLL